MKNSGIKVFMIEDGSKDREGWPMKCGKTWWKIKRTNDNWQADESKTNWAEELMNHDSTLDPQFPRLKGGKTCPGTTVVQESKMTTDKTFSFLLFLHLPRGNMGYVGGHQRTDRGMGQACICKGAKRLTVKHMCRSVGQRHCVLSAPPHKCQTQDTGLQSSALHQILITVQWTLERCAGSWENCLWNFHPDQNPFLYVQ